MSTTDTPLDAEELADIDADLAGELNHRWGVPHAVGRHLEAQLERYRTIITTLESELAETTDRLTAGDTEWRRTTALLADMSLNYLSERDRAAIAQAAAEALLTEVAELRAQVAKLLELNAEGRPWQITPKAGA